MRPRSALDRGVNFPLITAFSSSLFVCLFVCLFVSLILTGYKRPLEATDLWELSNDNKVSELVPKVRSEWEKELKRHEM